MMFSNLNYFSVKKKLSLRFYSIKVFELSIVRRPHFLVSTRVPRIDLTAGKVLVLSSRSIPKEQ